MYAAINKNGEIVYATTIEIFKKDQELFFCPKCRQMVHLKVSKRNKMYFSHKIACGKQEEMVLMEGESIQHKLAKMLLARLSTKSKIEYWNPMIQQQVDVYIPLETPHIFEFQKSKISAAMLTNRHEAYLTLTKYVYWVMANEQLQTSRVSNWQKYLLYYSKDKGFYWFVLDVQQQRLLLYYRLPMIFDARYWSCLSATIDLSCEYTQLPSFSFTKQCEFKHERYQVNVIREKQMLMMSEVYRPFFMWIHQEGVVFHTLPDWIFERKWQCLLIDSPVWMLLSFIVVRWSQCKIKVFDEKILYQWILEAKALGWLKFNPLPLIRNVAIIERLLEALYPFLLKRLN